MGGFIAVILQTADIGGTVAGAVMYKVRRALSAPARESNLMETTAVSMSSKILKPDDIAATGKELGRGSFGKVEKVYYLGHMCAAKYIKPFWEEQGGKAKEQFERECHIWSTLHHPNVVLIYGLVYKHPSWASSSQQPAIIMELMDCTLLEFMEIHGQIPLQLKVDILHQVAMGLVYIHGQCPPIIHRDITPKNILINEGGIVAKLADFGVAKEINTSTCSDTTAPGTRAFMPPEAFERMKVEDREYKDRYDVFSFGVLIIFVITQTWPEVVDARKMERGELIALNEVQRREKSLRRFTDKENRYFKKIIHMCLELKPMDRPTSEDLLTDLEYHLQEFSTKKLYIELCKALTESDTSINKLKSKVQELEVQLRDTQSQLSALQKETRSDFLLKGAKEPPLLQHEQLQEQQDEMRAMPSQLSASQKESDSQLKGGKEQPLLQHQQLQVELQKAEVAWKRAADVAKEQTEEEKATQELYCKFQGILNKLTPQKFQRLAEEAKELMNTTAISEERLRGCVKKLYNQAVQQPLYSVEYAKLALDLAMHKVKVGVNEDGTPKLMSFHAFLLTLCQEEFKKDMNDDEELGSLKHAIDEAQTDKERKQLKEKFEDAKFKFHHRSLGNVKFIGALILLKLLTQVIMHECVQRLLRSTTDGESLECFAVLMSTVGEEMDRDNVKPLMEKYFNRVNHIIEVKKIDSRVRFMLQDLVELRQNAWVPRKLVATNVPTTIDKIHEQAKKEEEEEMQKRIAHQQMMGQSRGDGSGRRGSGDWLSGELSSRPAPTTEVDTERLSRVTARTARSLVPVQLTRGAMAATKDNHLETVAIHPVVEAAKDGQLSTMRKLLEEVGSAEEQDKEGMTALLWASQYGHLPVVRELLDVYKVNVFHKDKKGQNAMHKAAEGGQLKMIKFLSQTFASRVHEGDSNGFTMLHFAARRGHYEVVCYLIEEVKMDPQGRDKFGGTALLAASYGGSVEVVRVLLKEFNSSLDEANNFGNTALLIASYGGNVEVVRMLLVEFNSSLKEVNNFGNTALLMASYGGSVEVVRMLLKEFNSSLDEANKFGSTALLMACYGGSVKVVRMLLKEFKSSLVEVNSYGNAALLMASLGGTVEVVRVLLEEFKSSLDEVNYDGYNALHLAAFEGHLEMVKYLLPKFGQKKFAVDNYGNTCVDVADQQQKQDVVDYLLQYGGFASHQ